MGILDQIGSLMSEQKESVENSIIVEFNIYLSWGSVYYSLKILNKELKEKDVEFGSLEELMKYLKANGWKIYN